MLHKKKLRSKWGTISSMFNAVHAAGVERRGGVGSSQKTISLSEWKAGVEACGVQLTNKQMERVYHLVEKGDKGVSLHDLERAMKLTGELAHGADRASSDRNTVGSAPTRVKPGQESAKMKTLFSHIWDHPVEAFCYFAQDQTGKATLTMHTFLKVLSTAPFI
jgi:hypothetical protein